VLAPALILWTGARAGERAGLALLAMVFMIVLLSDVSLRGRELTDTGLDVQSALKFILWASGWLLIFWRLNEFKEVARTWAGGSALAFALWCLFSTVYSPTPVYTFGASVGMLGMWFVAALVARRVDRGALIVTVTLALTVGMVISLALYLGLRDRAMAPTEGGTIFRLAGLFSAPNTLGRASALLLLLLLAGFYYVRRPMVWWPLVLVGACAAVVCLYLSGSRASMLALIGAGVVVLLRKRPVLLTVVSASFISISAVVLTFPSYLQDLMLMVSRTGRLSEVATLTGRTYIWEWVLSAAAERPLHGYGFGSTRVVMVEGYRGPWGFTTSSAHNAWLQAWITVGLIGVAMLLVNHLKLLGDFFRRPDRLRDGLFVLSLIHI
jgi:O-antigen ligase